MTLSGDNFQLSPQQEAAINLPMSLFENNIISDRESVGIFFTFYDTSTLFPVGERHLVSSVPSETKIGSSVIAATVGGSNFTFENLTEAVRVSFRIRKVSS